MSGMTDVYGYAREDFLELEPDEIAGALLPTLRATPAQISLWNAMTQARQAHGDQSRTSSGRFWRGS